MGKTFRRNERFRPKAHGRVFDKDKDFQPWKKPKKPDHRPSIPQSDNLKEYGQ